MEALLRESAPRVLGVLTRRHGRFDECEDAVQEALLAATLAWPADGLPANPVGWLVTVASRRLTDAQRSDAARRRREEADVALPAPGPVPDCDDTLTLLWLCCHPVLTPPAQVALTLRAVGGLTTAEIARGLLVPDATVAQRISRAKARIRASGARFTEPDTDERTARLPAVLGVLYLIFTEGHTASSGAQLARVELSGEAIRLTRALHAALPGEGEVAGLLALMMLTDARRAARTRPDGALVPLDRQDRALWDPAAVAEGTALVEATLATAVPGPYQLQAAIAAVHAEARRAEDTDWRQILGLYELLAALAPGPMVTLNRIVAVAEVRGPEIGLLQLDAAADDPALARHHRLDAVRAHLLDRAGRHDEARVHYRRAAERTLSLPERRYLLERALG
ncbi:RNA polymerase sigma factor [Pseudonocardia sp.]|uniref:RNA polymerase sigma factor n=1 Tax=Pseudonocardia sp. TaxID=60912 RepID=UPI003D145B55